MGFYQDVGDYFFELNLHRYAMRILSNLTEIKINNTIFWQIYAKHLMDAGMLDEAIEIAHKIVNLRPYDNISYHNLAIAYEKRGKTNMNAGDIENALKYYYKTAFSIKDWGDDKYSKFHYALDSMSGHANEIAEAVIVIEEFSVLADWSRHQNWPNNAPVIPKIDETFDKLLDTDLRVVIRRAYDTPYDRLGVVEPTTEEVSSEYGNIYSAIGGFQPASWNNGTEEYLLKSAPKGKYSIYTGFYGAGYSCLDSSFSLAVKATIYKNWGRPNQSEKTINYHLGKDLFCKHRSDQTDDELTDSNENSDAPDKPDNEDKMLVIGTFEME